MCEKFKLVVIVAVFFALKGSICADFKLSNIVRPSKYQLKLQTIIHDGQRQFSAEVKIHISVAQNITEFVLHAAGLNVTNITIFDSDELEQIEGDVSYILDAENEIINITTPELKNGTNYIVHLVYFGELKNDFVGFYQESTDPPTKTYFASISFQSTKFRYFCPSFDDMDIRAVFEIEVIHHRSYKAISNSEKVQQPPALDDFITTKFLPTKQLPTTSIAIIVSNFKSISMSDSQKIEIFGRDVFIDAYYLRDVMNTAFEAIKKFQCYFQPVHDMSSLKLVVQPDIISEISTFELIIYNQYNLIYQSLRMTTTHRDKMVRYITRTFAQQFFGNIMSMSSIQETFITDGFATFYEFLMANMLKPDDRIMDSYNTEIIHKALEIDSFITTDDTTKVEDDDVDKFASSKFSSLLRMYEKFIGPEKFKDKVLKFVEKFKFKTAKIEDFHTDFIGTATEDSEANEAFEYWFQNPGYPVIDVTFENSTRITLSQSRFLILSSEESESQPWTIPITYITSSGYVNSELIWMKTAQMELDIPENDWIIFNNHQSGYYRVNYDENTWKKIAFVLNTQDFTNIPVLNRAAIIDDALNLAIANKVSYGIVFAILSYLQQENDLIPWKVASNGLEYIDMMLAADDKLYRKFKEFLINLVEPIYNRLGTSIKIGESSFDQELREIAMFWMCKMKVSSCLNFVTSKFEEVMENFDNPDVDLQYAILCNFIRDASHNTFMELLNKTLSHNGYRDVLIKSLACSEDRESMAYLAQEIYCNDKLSGHDKRLLLIASIENYKYGVLVGLELADKCMLKIEESEANFMANSMVKKVWNEQNRLRFNNSLIILRNGGKLPKDKVIIYEKMAEENLKWMERNREEISCWLNDHKMSTSTENPPTETTTENDSTEPTEATTPDAACALKLNQIFMMTFIVILSQFY